MGQPAGVFGGFAEWFVHTWAGKWVIMLSRVHRPIIFGQGLHLSRTADSSTGFGMTSAQVVIIACIGLICKIDAIF